ncbi:MAG: MoxR family ATPase [Elusimicrobiota bacterium]
MSSKAKEGADHLFEQAARLKKEIGKVIVGQDEVIEQLLIAFFCRGHCLIVGVPGLAKTLIVSTFAAALDLQFKRIQFTPDLMPSDITGTEVLEQDSKTQARSFRFVKGPVFANLVLADEINRTPPKTQSALLQAMQENFVTNNGVDHALPEPFFVLATQNPIEQEGTYPLAEAQLDRFLFQVNISYPDAAQEINIVRRTTANEHMQAHRVLTAADVIRVQRLLREVPISASIEKDAVGLARLTRPRSGEPFALIDEFVAWGAGPRASQSLVLAAKARAVLAGRNAPSREDLVFCAYPVLRHRIILNFKAHAQSLGVDSVIAQVLRRAGLS